MLLGLFLCLSQISVLSAATPGLESKSIYNSKTVWDNQDGKKTSLSSLRGAPVVAAMLYTGCTASCPMTIADLLAIRNGLTPEEQKQVKFAVFSFDTVKDQPAKLKELAKKHDLDTANWSLFHGSKSAVRQMAALLGIRYKEIEGGDFDHSNVISILDKEGVITHQQPGVRQSPEASINALRAALKKN
jgi:protein SCO1/2